MTWIQVTGKQIWGQIVESLETKM